MLPLSRSLFAATCLFIPVKAVAQEPPAAEQVHVVTDCDSLLKRFGSTIEMGADSKVEPIDGGCHIHNIHIAVSRFVRWKLPDLRVTGADLFDAATAQRMPVALEVSVKRAAMIPSGVSPAQTYTMEVMQPGYDAHVSYAWNPESRDFALDDFTLTVPGAGSFSINGGLSNLSELPALEKKPPEDAKQAAIKTLSIKLENHDLFQTLIVPLLIGLIPEGEDPRVLVPRYQMAATVFIDGLPETVADADSKSALKAFVAHFPRPAGTYDMSVETQPPIRMEEWQGAADPAVLTGLINRMKISASHQPSAQE